MNGSSNVLVLGVTPSNRVPLLTASGRSLNALALRQKRVVIVGANWNGWRPRPSLRAWNHRAVGSVTAIGRRKLGVSHAKLKEVLHRGFANCSALAETLSAQDAAVFCLGVYTGVVSDAELRTISVDYTIEFTRVLRASSPR
jgi:hypothetical protein